MNVYYAHKKSIVKVKQRDDDFTVYTLGGKQRGVSGDYFASSLTNEQKVIPKEVFDEEYVAVELIETRPKKRLSPFEEQNYYRLFGEMGNLNQEEDKDFSENNTYKKVNERLFRGKAF